MIAVACLTGCDSGTKWKSGKYEVYWIDVSSYLPSPDHSRRAVLTSRSGNGDWQCSVKQRRLLADLSRELKLSEAELDERSQRLFQRPARQLNKPNASSLITDLLGEAEGLRAA